MGDRAHPYAESQADGDPSYSRGSVGRDSSSADREMWPAAGRPGSSGRAGVRGYGSGRGSRSYDGYDADEPARQRATGGGYGEYNYREADSPRGYSMGSSAPDRFGVRAETPWRPGESSRGQFSGRGPKGYQRSDERVREDVSDVLERNGDLDATEMIEVVVASGEVTLEGSVTDRWAKRLAEDLIEDVPGVKQVHNRLRVGEAAPRKDDEPGRSRSSGEKSGMTSDRPSSTAGPDRSSS